jgi:iron complex outermembrane receptor protein
MKKYSSVSIKFFCLLASLTTSALLFAQRNSPDSLQTMEHIAITAFGQNNAVNNGTIVKVISNAVAGLFNKTSLLQAFNAAPGVRLEERSPGSYRINIRGSSLRSPFGVRNVKVYWNDIPVTDAGGSTYFNQFAINNFSAIEIFKGPAGSMYGAGTGGLLLMNSFNNWWKPFVNAEYITGSFGLQNILFTAASGGDNSRNLISYAHTASNGYRDNTKNRKDNITYNIRLKISDKEMLTASILYTDMYYQTPGGLTLAEFTANPKQARPAAGGFPGAATAQAAIWQKNFLAGISHQYQFNKAFKNITSVYGNFSQIKNPTFRNYERRNEPGFGSRTVFSYDINTNENNLQLITGAELQQGFFNVLVSKNKNGNADTLQTNDDVQNTTAGMFLQMNGTIKNNWVITAGASINKTNVVFTRLNKYPVVKQTRIYKNEISPRFSLQKKTGKFNTVFASIARGFSPPTMAELLPSTGVISTFLEAEQGMNYEMGTRAFLFNNKLKLETSVYYFKLNNALVTRKDSSNADYFVNAGNTKQKGAELAAEYVTGFKNGPVNYITIKSALTLCNYKYGNFQKGSINYTGKYLPSVPKSSFSLLADVQFKNGIYFNCSWYYTDKIFLDDANAVSAAPYHLAGCKAGWKIENKNKVKMNFYAGADNLLNEIYSLGNDINAAGGRYYNTAPARNLYAGISVELGTFKKKQL